jgi:hypothetical protein
VTRTFVRLTARTLEDQLDVIEDLGAGVPRLHTIPSCPGLVLGCVGLVDRDPKPENMKAPLVAPAEVA